MRIHNRFATAFAAVAAFAAMAPVQAQDVGLIARVPFEFKVDNASLPRDTYRISHLNGQPQMLLLRGERKGVFVRTEEAGRQRDNASPSLLFHRYGDQYFLREVRVDGKTRLDVPETKAERAAAERRADRSTAVLEKVVIFAERR